MLKSINFNRNFIFALFHKMFVHEFVLCTKCLSKLEKHTHAHTFIVVMFGKSQNKYGDDHKHAKKSYVLLYMLAWVQKKPILFCGFST